MSEHLSNPFGVAGPQTVGAISSGDVVDSWEPTPSESPAPFTNGISMDVDIACVGFGPAMGGFLTALTRGWSANPGDPAFESKVLPVPRSTFSASSAPTISRPASAASSHGREASEPLFLI